MEIRIRIGDRDRAYALNAQTKALPARRSEGSSRRRKESPRRDWGQRADDVVRKTGGGGVWFRRWVFQEEEEEEEVRTSKEEGNKMSSVTAELQLQAERNWKDDVTERIFLLPSDIQKTKTNAQGFQPALESTGTTQR